MDFTTKLCDSISLHGDFEDVVNLFTCLEIPEQFPRPLIISTLTKKFFVTHGEHRGHHYHINNHHNELTSHLKEISEKLSEIRTPTEQKRKLGAAPRTNRRAVSAKVDSNLRRSANSKSSSLVNVVGSNVARGGGEKKTQSDGMTKKPVAKAANNVKSSLNGGKKPNEIKKSAGSTNRLYVNSSKPVAANNKQN